MNRAHTFDKFPIVPGIATSLFWFQAIGAILALGRLSRWRRLPPPVRPAGPGKRRAGVTIVIPTLNEAARIRPLLDTLPLQGADEILVVDSRSTDGTQALVESAAKQDTRIRLMTDDPLPAGWIGKAWALECARKQVQSPWILILDADTVPRTDVATSVLDTAERENLDVVSLGPRFAGQSAAERWVQPSLLVSLLYRFGPTIDAASGRVLANGQCFLVRRELLDRAGGFGPVRASFAEDVSLAVHLARANARVAFLDGAHLYDVRSYSSAGQMWREWGRSIDLKDATTPLQQFVDVLSIIAVQGMPCIVLVLAATGQIPLATAFVALNATLYAVRYTLLFALKHSYAKRGVAYWLSPASDPLAALRLLLSSVKRPTAWRGRSYQQGVRQ